MNISEGVEELVNQYRLAAIATQKTPEPNAQNAWHDRLQDIYRRLIITSAGQVALEELMKDTSDYVRLWAAVHSMKKCPEQAIAVLIELRDGEGPCDFDAKWTLRSLEESRS